MKKEFQAFQKVINYLEEFIDSDFFQEKIKVMRKKYGIPQKGFPLTEEAKKMIDKKGIYYFPQGIDKKKDKSINFQINKIVKDLPLKNYDFNILFKCYLFHNKVILDTLSNSLLESNLCKLVDSRSEFVEYGGDDLILQGNLINYLRAENMAYPIAIRLNPSATQRDIINYIKYIWPLISYLEKGYNSRGSKLGKIKKKNGKLGIRNKMIYKNRNLSLKKIERILSDEGFSLDQGSISKIRWLEIKKRKGKYV